MIKIEKLSKSYNRGFLKKEKFKVLNNINMNIKKGEIVGLIGASGSGKSTIGKILCGMEKFDSGKIYIDEKRIEKGEHRDEVNIIFQHPESSFDPRMTMYENLLEILKIKKLYLDKNREEIIEEYVELVGLDKKLLSRYVSEISGGEAQRFCIARALITNSKFLILDECTSMLDVSTQAQILEILLRLKKEKELTYLFISHDLEVAKILCDYVYILKEGVIVEEGNSEEIFINPKEEYTKKLVSIFNKLNI